jgi:hypothetical protein
MNRTKLLPTVIALGLVLAPLTAFSSPIKMPEPLSEFMLQQAIADELVGFALPPSLVDTCSDGETLTVGAVEFAKATARENSGGRQIITGVAYLREKAYNNCFVADFCAERKAGATNAGKLERLEIRSLAHLLPADGQAHSTVVGDPRNICAADRHDVFGGFPSNAGQELDLVAASNFEGILEKEFPGRQIPDELLHKVFGEDVFSVGSVDFVNVISLAKRADSYKITGVVQFAEGSYGTKNSAIFSAAGNLQGDAVASISMDALYAIIPANLRNSALPAPRAGK